MSWEDQGRQEHGWFGHGTAPPGIQRSPFSPHAIELVAGGDPRRLLEINRLIGRMWGGIIRPRPPASPSAPPPEPPPQPTRQPRPTPPAIPGPPVQQLPPGTLRFSQRTAGGRGRAEEQRAYVRDNGTIPSPVDAVRTPDGIVTIDNTRVAVAREQGINRIPVRVWELTDPIPEEYRGRFRGLNTWGDVLIDRVGRQKPPLPPSGTIDVPRMPPPGTSP